MTEHPCKLWEKYATKKQIKIRDRIEREAKKHGNPPSIQERLMINQKLIKSDWNG